MCTKRFIHVRSYNNIICIAFSKDLFGAEWRIDLWGILTDSEIPARRWWQVFKGEMKAAGFGVETCGGYVKYYKGKGAGCRRGGRELEEEALLNNRTSFVFNVRTLNRPRSH